MLSRLIDEIIPNDGKQSLAYIQQHNALITGLLIQRIDTYMHANQTRILQRGNLATALRIGPDRAKVERAIRRILETAKQTILELLISQLLEQTLLNR